MAYLLDDQTWVHDIDGHRGIRGGAECRCVEFRKAASRDRLQAEFLQYRTAITVSRTGHLRCIW